MNSIGHLLISILKSVLRIGACAVSWHTGRVPDLAIGFLVAEVLGILEELVDKRK